MSKKHAAVKDKEKKSGDRIKTMFFLIANRAQARNLLRTDVYNILHNDKSIKLVLFVPAYKEEEYEKEFYGERLVIEGIEDFPVFISGIDKFFGRVSLFYINTKTIRLLRKSWLLYERRQPFRYIFALLFLFIFGSIRPLRSLMRFLDFSLVKDNRLAHMFEKYHPDCVAIPNISIPVGRSFLREARKRDVATIGMIQSWDNITLSKYSYRLLPDKLIVQNDTLKKEVIRYLDVKEKDIFVSGLPHFDHYVTTARSSREDFCSRVGVDPSRRILLFASVTEIVNNTEWQTLHLLDEAMKEGRLPDDVIILLRHHPIRDMDTHGMEYSERVVFDDSKTRFVSGGREYTEILKDDMQHLANSIYHSAMVITTSSTMAIDAAALDIPVIDIGFDGWEKKRPLHESVMRYYTPYREFYLNIVNTGGVTVAYSFDELLAVIHRYLESPALDKGGRERIVREQCYKLDGASGRRVAEYIQHVVYRSEWS